MGLHRAPVNHDRSQSLHIVHGNATAVDVPHKAGNAHGERARRGGVGHFILAVKMPVAVEIPAQKFLLLFGDERVDIFRDDLVPRALAAVLDEFVEVIGREREVDGVILHLGFTNGIRKPRQFLCETVMLLPPGGDEDARPLAVALPRVRLFAPQGNAPICEPATDGVGVGKANALRAGLVDAVGDV